MIRVTLHPRRCWLFGHRTHHGTVGVGSMLLGIVLILHDIRDWRRWVRDFIAGA